MFLLAFQPHLKAYMYACIITVFPPEWISFYLPWMQSNILECFVKLCWFSVFFRFVFFICIWNLAGIYVCRYVLYECPYRQVSIQKRFSYLSVKIDCSALLFFLSSSLIWYANLDGTHINMARTVLRVVWFIHMYMYV